ncbi:MAG TPA: hypothetical protein VEJ46_14435 [Candidatus Acidoferrum sp.]|nr:hypothetical protein [Candidatus Acidoferrum sp.]
MAKKKKARKKKVASKKKKPQIRGKVIRPKKKKRAKRRLRGPEAVEMLAPPPARGLGAGAAGQSGDIQALPRGENIDSESVEELTEEGQDYEAEVVSGIENAREPDEGRVQTRRYVPPEER